MGRAATVVLPVLTLVLGVALGKWWSDREHASDRGRDDASRAAERRLDVPSRGEEPRRAETTAPATPPALASDPARLPAAGPEATDATPFSPEPAAAEPSPKAADAYKDGGDAPAGPKMRLKPDADPKSGQEEGAAKMLAVLFTNPAYRDMMVKQMVDQVAERVTFTDSQREAARKELDGAMQPLVEAFTQGPVEMKDLDPKFQVVKEDWKRRLTPLLTAEQGLAFQKWLDEKHSLQVKMGMDEKGAPVDPNEPEDK